MKRTPLYERQLKLGAIMTDFGGWELPVRYSSIIEEHETVRSKVGLFDVSHMGQILVRGKDAAGFIQSVVTNDIFKMKDGQALYSPMCYDTGGTVDDILIYRFSETEFLLVVNAANTGKDFEWLSEKIKGQAELHNASDEFAQLAIQGPLAQQVLQKLTCTDLSGMRFFRFAANVKVSGTEVLISRSGYTGEDGFEIYMPAEFSGKLWDDILTAGQDEGILPCGLGARDTLRLEAALPLYGHEISHEITPLEAGLDRFVKFDKLEFSGKKALLKQREEGLDRKLTGFCMEERAIPRNGYAVFSKDEKIGYVTSGSFSPTLKKNIGLALVKKEYAVSGAEFDIGIRNTRKKARAAETPFYIKKYKKG